MLYMEVSKMENGKKRKRLEAYQEMLRKGKRKGGNKK